MYGHVTSNQPSLQQQANKTNELSTEERHPLNKPTGALSSLKTRAKCKWIYRRIG